MNGIGLTDKELKAVQSTWVIVNENLRQHGIEILMALFATYPKYKDYFKRFKDIKTEDLPNNPSMKAHASAFMRGMCTYVDNVEDKDTLVRLIHDNVGRHFQRDIRFEQYQNTLDLLPGYLKEKLGDKLTADGASGWKKVIDTMCAVIKDEVNRLEKLN